MGLNVDRRSPQWPELPCGRCLVPCGLLACGRQVTASPMAVAVADWPRILHEGLQAALSAISPRGSSTNFFATPLSKSRYPRGALSGETTGRRREPDWSGWHHQLTVTAHHGTLPVVNTCDFAQPRPIRIERLATLAASSISPGPPVTYRPGIPGLPGAFVRSMIELRTVAGAS